jgi:hypothetical protein
MPQRAPRLPLLSSFQRQASTVLTAITKEIHQREQELAALKTEAARWQRLLHEPAEGDGLAVSIPQKRSAKRRRLDWSVIFKELPSRFTTKDVAQATGKPIAQIYTHLSGWRKEKKVRRVKDGYQKVGSVATLHSMGIPLCCSTDREVEERWHD